MALTKTKYPGGSTGTGRLFVPGETSAAVGSDPVIESAPIVEKKIISQRTVEINGRNILERKWSDGTTDALDQGPVEEEATTPPINTVSAEVVTGSPDTQAEFDKHEIFTPAPPVVVPTIQGWMQRKIDANNSILEGMVTNLMKSGNYNPASLTDFVAKNSGNFNAPATTGMQTALSGHVARLAAAKAQADLEDQQLAGKTTVDRGLDIVDDTRPANTQLLNSPGATTFTTDPTDIDTRPPTVSGGSPTELDEEPTITTDMGMAQWRLDNPEEAARLDLDPTMSSPLDGTVRPGKGSQFVTSDVPSTQFKVWRAADSQLTPDLTTGRIPLKDPSRYSSADAAKVADFNERAQVENNNLDLQAREADSVGGPAPGETTAQKNIRLAALAADQEATAAGVDVTGEATRISGIIDFLRGNGGRISPPGQTIFNLSDMVLPNGLAYAQLSLAGQEAIYEWMQGDEAAKLRKAARIGRESSPGATEGSTGTGDQTPTLPDRFAVLLADFQFEANGDALFQEFQNEVFDGNRETLDAQLTEFFRKKSKLGTEKAERDRVAGVFMSEVERLELTGEDQADLFFVFADFYDPFAGLSVDAQITKFLNTRKRALDRTTKFDNFKKQLLDDPDFPLNFDSIFRDDNTLGFLLLEFLDSDEYNTAAIAAGLGGGGRHPRGHPEDTGEAGGGDHHHEPKVRTTPPDPPKIETNEETMRRMVNSMFSAAGLADDQQTQAGTFFTEFRDTVFDGNMGTLQTQIESFIAKKIKPVGVDPPVVVDKPGSEGSSPDPLPLDVPFIPPSQGERPANTDPGQAPPPELPPGGSEQPALPGEEDPEGSTQPDLPGDTLEEDKLVETVVPPTIVDEGDETDEGERGDGKPPLVTDGDTTFIDEISDDLLDVLGSFGFDDVQYRETQEGAIKDKFQLARERLARQFGISPGGSTTGKVQRQFELLEGQQIQELATLDRDIQDRIAKVRTDQLTAFTQVFQVIAGTDLEQQRINQLGAQFTETLELQLAELGLNEVQVQAAVKKIHADIANSTRATSAQIGQEWASLMGQSGTESGKITAEDLGVTLSTEDKMSAFLPTAGESATRRILSQSFAAMMGRPPTEQELNKLQAGTSVSVDSMPTLESRKLAANMTQQNMERIAKYDAMAKRLIQEGAQFDASLLQEGDQFDDTLRRQRIEFAVTSVNDTAVMRLARDKFTELQEESDRNWNIATGNVAEQFELDQTSFNNAQFMLDSLNNLVFFNADLSSTEKIQAQQNNLDTIAAKFFVGDAQNRFKQASAFFDRIIGDQQAATARSLGIDAETYAHAQKQVAQEEERFLAVWGSLLGTVEPVDGSVGTSLFDGEDVEAQAESYRRWNNDLFQMLGNDPFERVATVGGGEAAAREIWGELSVKEQSDLMSHFERVDVWAEIEKGVGSDRSSVIYTDEQLIQTLGNWLDSADGSLGADIVFDVVATKRDWFTHLGKEDRATLMGLLGVSATSSERTSSGLLGSLGRLAGAVIGGGIGFAASGFNPAGIVPGASVGQSVIG